MALKQFVQITGAKKTNNNQYKKSYSIKLPKHIIS